MMRGFSDLVAMKFLPRLADDAIQDVLRNRDCPANWMRSVDRSPARVDSGIKPDMQL